MKPRLIDNKDNKNMSKIESITVMPWDKITPSIINSIIAGNIKMRFNI
jgi:hypothetical protein